MTIPRPRDRVAVCYESTMRGYLELRVRSYDSKDPDVAKLFASEHVYVREDVAEAEAAALRRERDALRLVANRAGDVLVWVSRFLPPSALDGPGSECITALNEAVDAAMAGKGVG